MIKSLRKVIKNEMKLLANKADIKGPIILSN